MNIIRTDLADNLEHHRQEFIAARDLLGSIATREDAESMIVLGNFAILTMDGGLSREEYLQLYGVCHEKGDYVDLALRYADVQLRRVREWERTEQRPSNLASSLQETVGFLRSPTRKIELQEITKPAIYNMPSWWTALDAERVQQRGLQNVFDRLGPASVSSAGGTEVSYNVVATKHQIRSVVPPPIS